MSGILFLIDVVAVMLIVLWSWALERPGGAWRVRLFDMLAEDSAEAEPKARAAPRWGGPRRDGRPWRPAAERRAGALRSAPARPQAAPAWRRNL
jgi:hypothetical protein